MNIGQSPESRHFLLSDKKVVYFNKLTCHVKLISSGSL